MTSLFSRVFSNLTFKRPTTVTPLEASIQSIRTGIKLEEALEMIGVPPTNISQQEGILRSPVMMLTPTEENIAQYGNPKAYSMYVWNHEQVNGVVVVDEKGIVVGRWTWHSHN